MKKEEIILAIDSLVRAMDMCNRTRLNDSNLQRAIEQTLLKLINSL